MFLFIYVFYFLFLFFWYCCTKKQRINMLVNQSTNLLMKNHAFSLSLQRRFFFCFLLIDFVKNSNSSPCWHVSINLKRCHIFERLFLEGKRAIVWSIKGKKLLPSFSFFFFLILILIFFEPLSPKILHKHENPWMSNAVWDLVLWRSQHL